MSERKRITAMIVDDEPMAREGLRNLIRIVDEHVDIIGEATGVRHAFELLESNRPDVLFLDVEMLDGSGFELLNAIDNVDFQVVFTTAFDHYAAKAFREHATDYLLKPIAIDELRDALGSVRKKMISLPGGNDLASLLERFAEITPKKVAIKSNGRTDLIDPKEMMYCKADGVYSKIHLRNSKIITTSMLLKKLHERLGNQKFVRIDHSTLVNLDYVESYQRSEPAPSLTIADGTSLKVSRRKKQDLDEALERFL